MMAVKDILKEIEQDVIDVTNTTFTYSDTTVVPGSGDGDLTYERGKEKRGKKLCTCVLYVDIRNSVALTEKHHSLTMGRIYTAFTKAVLKVARYHNGHTRNIIGDRVMIVFPEKDCFTAAIDCAISINHIAQYIMTKQFHGVDFKCGIGIDYGELRIIKVGIQRNGTESGENKGLVWAGYPANIASRLTDNANKTVNEDYYEVNINPINPKSVRPFFYFLESRLGPMSNYDAKAPRYLSSVKIMELSPTEFAESIRHHKDGSMYFFDGNMINFTKKTRKTIFPPILMTEDVFNGFKKSNPDRKSILNNNWTEQKHSFKNVKEKIFGGNVHWIV